MVPTDDVGQLIKETGAARRNCQMEYVEFKAMLEASSDKPSLIQVSSDASAFQWMACWSSWAKTSL